MKRLHLALILPCILFSLPAVAEQELIKPQTQGEVTFVNGGVGGDQTAEPLDKSERGEDVHLAKEANDLSDQPST